MAVPPSLKELAKLLGLAPSTVSKALKGHPDIREATRERVVALAQQMHYRPNELASSLRVKHSKLIAVIVPCLTYYFYAEVVSSILQAAYDKKYKVIVFNTEESYERETAICHNLEKSGIEGVLVAPAKTTMQTGHFHLLIDAGIPVIIFDRFVGQIDTDKILSDDFQGAYLAVSHMIEGGCRKIAHIALPQHLVWGQKRQMGYIQALLDHRLPIDRSLIVEYNQVGEVDEMAFHLINNYPIDGIFVATDEAAVKVMNALNRQHCMVPTQVALCGFGNSPVAEVSCPPLTTVSRKGAQMGVMAFELLLARVEKDISSATVTKLLKSNLVIRGSTLSV